MRMLVTSMVLMGFLSTPAQSQDAFMISEDHARCILGMGDRYVTLFSDEQNRRRQATKDTCFSLEQNTQYADASVNIGILTPEMKALDDTYADIVALRASEVSCFLKNLDALYYSTASIDNGFLRVSPHCSQ